ncbi:MAG TPA: hypothetical protein VFS46_01980 [Nitrososphaera sp.]|nr:hypothetical protein [Nitrososphaera sp.]
MTSKIFYAALAAGIAFIAIGAASSIYTNTAVDVPLDNVVGPGMPDIITPNMNVGSTASIMVAGSTFNVTIMDPDRQVIASENNAESFSYDLTAQKAGEHRIEIVNTGNSDLTVSGHAQTKSSPLGLTGALMLMITGVILVGLSLRFRNR